jgi:hypothetical protein
MKVFKITNAHWNGTEWLYDLMVDNLTILNSVHWHVARWKCLQSMADDDVLKIQFIAESFKGNDLRTDWNKRERQYITRIIGYKPIFCFSPQ